MLLQGPHMSGAAAACELPAALCAEMLQHVPQQDRLCQCALVCRSWALAAVQATVSIASHIKTHHAPAFQRCLAQHAAGQLTTLKVSLFERDGQTLQLPLDKMSKLQHLKLEGLKLQLSGEDHRPCSDACAGSWESIDEFQSHAQAAWPTLSSLQYLKLSDVELVNISSLFQITKAPQLRSLILTGSHSPRCSTRAVN